MSERKVYHPSIKDKRSAVEISDKYKLFIIIPLESKYMF